MTQHNAAARRAASPTVERVTPQAPVAAPNDNGSEQRLITPAIEAALRHFGEHGLGSAQAALDRAALSDNEAEATHWLGIARMFDRQAVERSRHRRRGD